MDVKLQKCLKVDSEPKPLVKISVPGALHSRYKLVFERTASGLRFRLQVGPSLLVYVCLIIFLCFPLFLHEPVGSLLCSTSWVEMRPAGQDGQEQRLFILRRCLTCGDGFKLSVWQQEGGRTNSSVSRLPGRSRTHPQARVHVLVRRHRWLDGFFSKHTADDNSISLVSRLFRPLFSQSFYR